MNQAETTATNPQAGVAPEADTVVHDQVEADGEADEGDEETAGDVDSGIEEVDYEGERYQLPKKLKDALLRQQDYTQKTQEVSEKARAVEARAKQLQESEASTKEFMKEVSQLQYMNDQLEEYNKLDWQRLMLEDKQNGSNHTLELQIQMTQLQNKRNGLAQTLTEKQNERISNGQRNDAKALEDMRAALQKEIKGYGPDVENNLKAFVREQGLPEESFTAVRNPAVIKILHQAYAYNQLMKKQAQKPAAPPAQPIQPLIKTKNKVTKDPDKMNIEEWKEWRGAKLRKQRP